MGPAGCPSKVIIWCLLPMSRLSILDKAIGKVEAGVLQNQVAALFGVSPGAIFKLKEKFCETADVKDRPWSGHPMKTGSSPFQHWGTVGCLLEICRQGLQDFMACRQTHSDQTVRNRLHTGNLRAHKSSEIMMWKVISPHTRAHGVGRYHRQNKACHHWRPS